MISIFNQYGEKVLEVDALRELKKEINVMGLTSGIYLVQVFNGEYFESEKVSQKILW